MSSERSAILAGLCKVGGAPRCAVAVASSWLSYGPAAATAHYKIRIVDYDGREYTIRLLIRGEDDSR
jgi:hypothetical protein